MRKLLTLTALLALALPAIAQAAPHFYLNGVILPESLGTGSCASGSVVCELGVGTLTMSTPGAGAVTCNTVGAGHLWNPRGGSAGENEIVALTTFDCTSEACEAANGYPYVEPRGLVSYRSTWEGVLTEPLPGVRRLAVGRGENLVDVTVLCIKPRNGVPSSSTEYTELGTLTPLWVNGTTIGSSPSRLVFDVGSGELSGATTVTGAMSLEEYEGWGVIKAK